MHTSSAALLSPEHFTVIKNLSVRARLIVEGTIAGLHKSPYHGFSAEFLEYRPYRPGESARKIDWRKYAKTDRAFVRLFEDETNLYANLLVDISGSMGFGSHKHVTKHEYAKSLAAALSWILISQRDAVGLALFDQEVREALPARSTNAHLTTILARLDGAVPGGETGCGPAIDRIASTLTKRGLCVVVSDFMEDTESMVRGLRHLRFKRQDVLALCIVDPAEEEFAIQGPVRIRDMESGKQLVLDGRIAAEFLDKGLTDHHRNLGRACRDMGIDFERVRTDEPFYRALTRVLQKRKGMW